MFDVVRSREGLAYTATSAYSANFDVPGVFASYAATKSESTGKAIREMINVIRSMQTQPPTEGELKYGRDSYLNSFVFQFDSPDEVVNRIMSYDYFGQSEEFLQQTRDRVERVKAEDVVEAAKKCLRPDAIRLLVVGKSEDFDIPLDSLGLGPVQTIDIAIPTAEAWLESRQNQSTDEKGALLLAEAVEAHGGLDRFKNIRAISYESATSVLVGGQEMRAQGHLIRELPDKSLSVMNLMGQQIFDVTDGVIGWRTDRRSGELVAMTADEIKEGARERNRGLLLVFQRSDDGSYTVEYDGVDTTDPSSAEYVTLLATDGTRVCRLGVDPNTHLLVSQWYWGKTPIGEGMVKEAFTEWADVEGVRLPAKVVRTLNGQVFSTSVYTRFTLNPEILPGTFAKP
jgi:zinc protease